MVQNCVALQCLKDKNMRLCNMIYKFSSYNLREFANKESTKIFILGLMGAGKTSLATELSLLMDLPINESESQDDYQKEIVEISSFQDLEIGHICSSPVIVVKTSLLKCCHNFARSKDLRFLSREYFREFFIALKSNYNLWFELKQVEQLAKNFNRYCEYYAE